MTLFINITYYEWAHTYQDNKMQPLQDQFQTPPQISLDEYNIFINKYIAFPDICRNIINNASTVSKSGQTREALRRVEKSYAQQRFTNDARNTWKLAIFACMHQRDTSNVPCRTWKWKKLAIGCRDLWIPSSQRRKWSEKKLLTWKINWLSNFSSSI